MQLVGTHEYGCRTPKLVEKQPHVPPGTSKGAIS